MNNWHAKSIDSIFKELNTSEKGLRADDAQKRIREKGENILTKEKKTSALHVLLSQFKSSVIYILLFAAIVSYSTGEMPEFFVVSFIILIVILLGFFQEYKASKEMEALKNLTPKMTKVLREGKPIEVMTKDITLGDIIHLERGNLVPADMRIIQCNNLHVDESAMTGESVPVTKTERIIKEGVPLAEMSNMLFAGTQVTNGNAVCVVVKTGKETELGKISTNISEIKDEATPLQKRVDKLGKQISYGVVAICVLVFFIGLWRGESIVGILLLSIAVAVAGIPESMPPTIAVTLAYGVKNMAKKNAIIKRLPAVETLGTCTVICSDKTGTLTQNKMVIEKIITFDSEFDVTGSGFDPKGLFLMEGKKISPDKHKTLSKVFEIGVLCNNADIKEVKGEWSIDGEPTEGALIVMAKKAGMDKLDMYTISPRIKEHPFDADRKCMSTVHRVAKKEMVYSKGAPELLLRKANYYFRNGEIKRLTKDVSEKILAKNMEYASKGMRVLGLAFKEHKSKKYEIEHVESDLVFVGLVAMRDPPEPNAKESVNICRQAGIKVVMITGDNKITAEAIAKDLGICAEGDTVIEGSELDKLNDDNFLKIIDSIHVYARATPKHKLRIVETLQKKGHIVAMTGDGVNDAPALKKADIGIAMGKRGTDVAKEAAEMVLVDDNFSTIAGAVKEGRTIYTNIRKSLYYELTTSISEVILILIAVIIGMSPPLTALMVLFLNLVTGDLPALGLTVEKSPKNIMLQKPRSPKESIINEYLMLKIAQIVPIFVLGTLIMYMVELVVKAGGVPKAQTIAFITMIAFELFHVFNAKSWDETAFTWDSLKNIFLNGGVIYSVLFVYLVIYFPPAHRLFEIVPLSAVEILLIVAVASSVLFYNEIQKAILNTEISEREKMAINQA
ncbi:cation-translocating P-type ATPase [Candidatus Woesearchaeota archaeon]|nr:cation-translocating P-type ATPase [Candidatus Woesearchaeota archaeon]